MLVKGVSGFCAAVYRSFALYMFVFSAFLEFSFLFVSRRVIFSPVTLREICVRCILFIFFHLE